LNNQRTSEKKNIEGFEKDHKIIEILADTIKIPIKIIK